jgi:hypothetical protein
VRGVDHQCEPGLTQEQAQAMDTAETADPNVADREPWVCDAPCER